MTWRARRLLLLSVLNMNGYLVGGHPFWLGLAVAFLLEFVAALCEED